MIIICKALQSKQISFQLLEKCVGKCMSMSVAVPAAKLYTRNQYAALSFYSNLLGSEEVRHINPLIPVEGLLFDEMIIWTNLHSKLLNGALKTHKRSA